MTSPNASKICCIFIEPLKNNNTLTIRHKCFKFRISKRGNKLWYITSSMLLAVRLGGLPARRPGPSQLFVGGRWIEPSSGRFRPLFAPPDEAGGSRGRHGRPVGDAPATAVRAGEAASDPGYGGDYRWRTGSRCWTRWRMPSKSD